MLNAAIAPRVEVELKAFENTGDRAVRVSVHADSYNLSFRFNPDQPAFDHLPVVEGAINSLPPPGDLALQVFIRSRVPAASSTGTSAAVCVALLGGLARLTGRTLSSEEIVSLAHLVETEKLNLQCGIQDQICATHGGVCYIHMHHYPEARVTKLDLGDATLKALNRRLCLIYLGEAHSSSALHEKVIALLEKRGSRFKTLQKLRDLAEGARDCMLRGDLAGLGDLMVQNNECQRSLHPGLISDKADSVIHIARNYRAAGWKVNGAGGSGGSITVLSHEDEGLRTEMLREINALRKGVRSIPMSLSSSGLEVREGGSREDIP